MSGLQLRASRSRSVAKPRGWRQASLPASGHPCSSVAPGTRVPSPGALRASESSASSMAPAVSASGVVLERLKEDLRSMPRNSSSSDAARAPTPDDGEGTGRGETGAASEAAWCSKLM